MAERSVDLSSGIKLIVWMLGGVSRHPWRTPLAYVITTSGTTGQPKLVHVPHRCILPNITHLRYCQSTNKTVNQSVNQVISQSIKQSIN